MIFILSFLFTEMAFRNFVVSGGAKEASFLPKDPNEVSYGVGFPSISVNNKKGDARMVEPIASAKPSKASELVNIGESSQLVKNVADSVDPLSEDDRVMIVGSSSGIAERV